MIEPFIFEDQAGPRPESGNYGTIKLTPLTMEGQDSEVYTVAPDNKTEIDTTGQREILCSVNIYREDAVQLMGRLQTRLQTKRFKERINLDSLKKGQPFTIIDALAIQDLTALVQSDYEQRSQMDVRLRTVSSYCESVETIGTVVLDGSVQDVAGQTKDDGKLTISDS